MKTLPNNSQGQIIVIALVILGAVITSSLSLYSLLSFFSRDAQRGLAKEQAFQLAEAGIEAAIWSLNTNGNYPNNGLAVPFGQGEYKVVITNLNISSLSVESTGYIPNAINPIAQRTVKAQFSLGTQNIAFHYAAHIGQGGLILNSNATVYGNVHSNGNIVGNSNSLIDGDAQAVGTISSPYPQVTGTKTPGVAPVAMPDIQIAYWQDQANQNNDPIIGDLNITTDQNLGPRKIDGNLTISNNAKVTIMGPVYVTGNLTMNSNTELILSPSFGSNGTVIIVDGQITLNSNAKVKPTPATPKGYILLVSTKTGPAITLNSNITGGLFYSPNGDTVLNANAHVVAVTAYKLILNSNATLTYDLGLASAQFSSGTSGGWEIVKSSYQIKP